MCLCVCVFVTEGGIVDGTDSPAWAVVGRQGSGVTGGLGCYDNNQRGQEGELSLHLSRQQLRRVSRMAAKPPTIKPPPITRADTLPRHLGGG